MLVNPSRRYSMSKKQSSLMSFFKGAGGHSTPKVDKKVVAGIKDVVKIENDNENRLLRLFAGEQGVDDEEAGRPLKRVNLDDSFESPVKAGSTKRRRLVISSDEEDVADDEENVAAATPKRSANSAERKPRTPRTPASVSRSQSAATPSSVARASRARLDAISTEMAESFIGSFRAEDMSMLDDSIASVATLDQTMYQMDEKKSSIRDKELETDLETDTYDHEQLAWLKPENIKDSSGRKMSEPDYDPTSLWVPADFLNQQTPGHKQWWALKAANFDTILLFKVGKFYELYHMDAVVSVECLSFAFMKGSFAHTGFPEHAYGKFADQLVSRGHKVARVEQTETPQQLEERNQKKGGTKDKVVRRELCRVTTVGTRTFGVLDGTDGGVVTMESGAKYLMAIKELSLNSKSVYGVCFIDTSIGTFHVGQFEDDDYRSFLRTMLASHAPVQALLERGQVSSNTSGVVNSMLSAVPKDYLCPKKQFLTAEDTVKMLSESKYLGSSTVSWPALLRSLLDADSIIPKPDQRFAQAWSALGAVLSYLKRCLIDVDMVTMTSFERYAPNTTQSTDKPSLKSSESLWEGRRLVLDGVSLENLNLVPSGDHQAGVFSLYNTLNKCVTPFGKRLLREWVCVPVCSPSLLVRRQDAVCYLTSPSSGVFMEQASALMKSMPDLDRLVQKIHTLGLKYRAESHPDSRAVMFDAAKYNKRKIADLLTALNGFTSCQRLLELYETEKKGRNGSTLMNELLADEDDNLANLLHHFKLLFDHDAAEKSGSVVPERGRDVDYDAALEQVEVAKKALVVYRKKVEGELNCSITYWGTGKNRYQMEIPESKNLSSKYELKSKRKGFRRYQTSTLVGLISDLSDAEAEQDKQAADATRKVFAEFDKSKSTWLSMVQRVASLDVLMALARYATGCGLAVCRPKFVFDADKPFLRITHGSHPCLVTNLTTNEGNQTTTFIANDAVLGGVHPSCVLLTGPNMGGKSTLMRQVAVLTVMAHMGCMVPATEMELTPVDRIFTRIGANDRIMCGQSTFFLELNETQVMLRDATAHSLVLVDELGRGTSTFDGTAIASAVLSSLSRDVTCRAYFSTHYHSLCQTAAEDTNVAQAHMACMVENENDEDPTEESVTFLYRLTNGVCPKSYGFYAAKLAGVREEVVRAAFVASGRMVGRRAVGDGSRLAELRSAAANGASVEDLRRMVECL